MGGINVGVVVVVVVVSQPPLSTDAVMALPSGSVGISIEDNVMIFQSRSRVHLQGV